ncbi:MAG: Gfo/Idh/MocA family oxidoreductase [Pyrinomonadaceae bacterium]
MKEKIVMENIDRRKFILSGAAAAASAPFIRTTASGRSSSANDTVNIAVIGVRSRGQSHYTNFANIPNVNIATFCDIDDRLFPEALSNLSKITKQKPTTVTDLRRVLDDKTIDAVAIATPDHWHALATIWACQAGKDVYVEKPTSHNIWEGRRMVEAARKYNRVVQAGTQNRSNPAVQAA